MSNNTTESFAPLLINTVTFTLGISNSNLDATGDSDYFSTDPKYIGLTEVEEQIVGGIYLSMAIIGFILNVLTLCIVGLGENVNKEVKIQIISLAAADVLSTTFGATPIILEYLRISFNSNTSVCRFITFFEHASHYTSLLCNVAISLERFVIVFFPFRASQYNQTYKLAVVGLVWLCGCLPALDMALIFGVVEVNGISVCLPEKLDLAAYQIRAWLYNLKYFLPVSVILAAYALVFVKISAQKSNGVKRNLSNKWRKGLEKVSV